MTTTCRPCGGVAIDFRWSPEACNSSVTFLSPRFHIAHLRCRPLKHPANKQKNSLTRAKSGRNKNNKPHLINEFDRLDLEHKP